MARCEIEEHAESVDASACDAPFKCDRREEERLGV